MPNTALERLARELDGPLPPGLEMLSPADLNQLADAVAQLKRKQAADLSAALDQALSHVPFLLRGAVRKILFS